MKHVTIMTPRLKLRPVAPGDGLVFAEAAAENFTDKYFWFDAKCQNVDWQAKYTRDKQRDFVDGSDLSFAILTREGEQFLGIGGLHPSDFTLGRFGMSYWIRSNAAGKGYATELGNALLRFAFGQLRATSVGLGYIAGNEGSQRVMQKLGFTRYARESHYSLPDGRMVDAEIFRRTGISGLPPLEVSWEFDANYSS